MSPEDRTKLKAQLRLHEGVRKYPYRCTAGKLSIGVGYNLDDRGLGPMEAALGRRMSMDGLFSHGLTDDQIDRVLDWDIDYFEGRVVSYFPDYSTLDPIRQRVVLDFAFNLGRRGLGFTNAIAALKKKDYAECAYQMMRSLWATQVGDGEGRRYDRAERLTDMMRSGADYTY